MGGNGILPRFQRHGAQMHQQLVFPLAKTRRRKFMLDEHVFAVPDLHAVQVHVRYGVDAFKAQKIPPVRFLRPRETDGIEHVAGFIFEQLPVVIPEKRILHQAVAHIVQRPVSGHLCVQLPAAQRSQLRRRADLPIDFLILKNRQLPALLYFPIDCQTHVLPSFPYPSCFF